MVNGDLPNGWTWKSIGDVTSPIEKVDPTQKPKKEFTYLDIASIDNSLHKITEPKSYYGADAPSRARQLVKANDVLFSTVRTYLEKIAQVPEAYDGQIASTGFSILRSNGSVHPSFLFYFSLTQKFLEPLNELQRGTSYPAVRDNDVRVQMIPIPPLPEQERIVAKIEELFMQLEAGTSALERVQAGLRRYKASVLKAAFEASLLESKEVERSNNRETSEKLLQLRGKSPIVDNTLPTLPVDWCWAKIKDLAFVTKLAGFEYTKYVKYKETGEIPVIRAQNVTKEDGFRERNFVYVEENLMKQLTRSGLHGGEVLMVFVGAGLGNVGIVPDGKDFFLGPNVALIRGDETVVYNKYLYHFLQSDLGKKHVQGFSKSTAQGSISMGNIRDVTVPLPPLEEQRRIVAEVERRLSVARAVESAVEGALVRASRLRQAVLKSAFEGKLLSSDTRGNSD